MRGSRLMLRYGKYVAPVALRPTYRRCRREIAACSFGPIVLGVGRPHRANSRSAALSIEVCGIAGAVGVIDDLIIEGVHKINASLAHRGPDADGFMSDVTDGRGIAFAHRRLAIVDLSDAGRQPMLDPRTGNIIVFNGEVYNFDEIGAELQREGIPIHSRCDTEVILKAYSHWGESAIERFRGMFALAIWSPARRDVFFVRDRLGIKPLYYATVERPTGKTLLFASEVRALLATGLVPRTVDPVALRTFLWNGFVAGSRSIVRGIELLPQASTARVRIDEPSIRPQRYWHIPTHAAPADANPGPAIDALHRELLEAVKLRLISDVPLGIFLSGGVDSSAVAALAAEASTSRVATFNISFDEVELDESAYARTVARELNTEHHEVRLTQRVFASSLRESLDSIDQPTFDAINTYFVSRAVRNAGITVALAGSGGDELFGGYRTFADLPPLARWGSLGSFVPPAAARTVTGLLTRWKMGPAGEVPPQVRWGKLADVVAAHGDLVRLYQSAYGLFTQDFYQQLAKNVPAATVEYGLEHEHAAELARSIRDLPTLDAISVLELNLFVGERLLRDTDAASMAVALEARVPLLDHRVVERTCAVPTRERYEPVPSKALLKKLALGRLDPSTFERKKAGFVLPFDRWCREELRPELDEIFHDNDLCHRLGLDPIAVQALWRSFQQQAPGMYWSRAWTLFVLLWWARRHDVALAA